MLFVVVLKAHPGTLNERAVRRMQWDYPEGIKPVAEFWLQTDDPSVISVVELDNVGLLTVLRMAWDDLFEIQAYPAVTAQEGLEMLRQLAPA